MSSKWRRPWETVVTKARSLKGDPSAVINSRAYAPIPKGCDIRLVQINPGCDQEPLECSLIPGVITFSQYEALSYAWGNTDLVMPIKLDGSTFMVTKSLEFALRHLRMRDRWRILWIDAICINQTDIKERTSQVQYMRQVYEHATSVVVWLEDAPHDIDKLIAFADSEAVASDDVNWSVGVVLDELGTRDWWQRIWVIQEITVSRNAVVYCAGKYGTHTIPWALFCTMVKKCPLLPERFRREVDDLWDLSIRLRHNGAVEGNLPSLARKFRNRRSTDPRDMLFALVGLIGSTQPALLVPDYSKDMSSVRRELAQSWIRHYKSLLIISHPELHKYTLWHPIPAYWDSASMLLWNKSDIEEFSLPTSHWDWDFMFSASGNSRAPEAVYPHHKDVLVLKSIWTDTIVEILQGWYPENLHSISVSTHVQNFQTIMSKKLKDGPVPPEYLSTHSKLLCEAILTLGRYVTEPRDEDARMEYNSLVYHVIVSFIPFITRRGYIGLGPGATRIGDTVSVFLGAEVPLVLLRESRVLKRNKIVGARTDYDYSNSRRSIPKSLPPEDALQPGCNALHRIVGQAYVKGIMYYNGDIEDDLKHGKTSVENCHIGA